MYEIYIHQSIYMIILNLEIQKMYMNIYHELLKSSSGRVRYQKKAEDSTSRFSFTRTERVTLTEINSQEL